LILDEINCPNGQNIARIAEGLGLTPQEADAVVREVVPEISLYLERNTLSRGGLADLIRSLGDSHRESYLKPETDLAAPSAVDEGNRLLGQILQTKYQSRALLTMLKRKRVSLLPRSAKCYRGSQTFQWPP
jgi:hypothetical protein